MLHSTPAPTAIKPLATRANDSLASEAYSLLARLARDELADAELGRLSAVASELDRRGVAYRGEW
jgi:hypothetical protein